MRTVIDKLKRDRSAKFALRSKIQRWGNRVQIDAALSDTATDAVIWSETFTANTDHLALVSRVADAIAHAISPFQREARPGPTQADQPGSLRALLARTRTPGTEEPKKDLIQAVRHFQNATKVDPRYAQAYSGLADAYALPGGHRDRWDET
jgi:hypothetical protein